MDPRIAHILPTSVRPAQPMVRGQGDFLFDADGRAYLDFVQGWAVNALGHAPSVVADALARQAATLLHAGPGFYNEPQLALSAQLAQLTGLAHVFVCCTGAEANESAIKLARKWGGRERAGAHRIVTCEGGFHGRTLATMSASGKTEFGPLFEPKVSGFLKLPYGDPRVVAEALDESVVAVLVEPIQGEAGVIVPDHDFLTELRKITRARGILLMIDEVQTGVGRTGTFCAFQAAEILPDVVTLGKGLGGGVPAAAMLCRPELSCFAPGDQGGTFTGHPLVSAAAAAVVHTVAEPDFLASVRTRGALLERSLEKLARDHALPPPRGRGLLWAQPLRKANGAVLVTRAREEFGLLLNAPRPDVLRFMPALNVSEAAIHTLCRVLDTLLREL